MRLSHRVKAFNYLPFIAVTNPSILRVMELYKRSFYTVSDFNKGRKISTNAESEEFAFILETLLQDHGNVIEDLSNGFREAHKHILEVCGGDQVKTHELEKKFLDETLTSRLGLRLLIQHHLLIRDQINGASSNTDRIGIIEKRWKPADEIYGVGEKIRAEWEQYTDKTPRIRITGHAEITFPYIPMGVNYIIQELLKNSFRAVIKAHEGARKPPPIDVLIANNKVDFTLRISDRGKGIPPASMSKIWDYHFTTAKSDSRASKIPSLDHNIDEKGLAGYGIGLPVSRAYAACLGGSLEITSMDGIGSDAYLTLRHLDPAKGAPFRI